ncbi:MAG: lytic transglycosylase domain-containing protein [Bacteroidetes bacterium]|nr:MAG: lytic transglycosylase domain-containing protein [Bacteroidota bacterium]
MNSKSPKKRIIVDGRMHSVKPEGYHDLEHRMAFIRKLPLYLRQGSVVLLLVVASNLLTHRIASAGLMGLFSSKDEPALYLIDKAEDYVYDVEDFEKKVRYISRRLNIKPEWLMAVMYSESKFDPSVLNYQGTGAVGLIQFTPAAARKLNVSPERLRAMDAIQQLDYVYQYLQQVKVKHGNFEHLNDLYLAVLAPEALGKDYCYTIFARPSPEYERNAILDENQDGSVTVSDIDRRMERMFPTAYWLGSERPATE